MQAEKVKHSAEILRAMRRSARNAVVWDGESLAPAKSITLPEAQLGELTDAATLLEAQDDEIRRLRCLLNGAHETIRRNSRLKGA
jgi:hypothetical protein